MQMISYYCYTKINKISTFMVSDVIKNRQNNIFFFIYIVSGKIIIKNKLHIKILICYRVKKDSNCFEVKKREKSLAQIADAQLRKSFKTKKGLSNCNLFLCRYNMKVTAHNNAGFSIAEYEFATLTSTGGKRGRHFSSIFLHYSKLKEREKTKREGKKCLRAKRDYSYGEVTEKERKREK